MVAMALVYSLTAYPFGWLSDRMSHRSLLAMGLVILAAADLVLASSSHWSVVIPRVMLWALHMSMTQGLLTTMSSHPCLPDLWGTAFGFFNLVSGVAILLVSYA